MMKALTKAQSERIHAKKRAAQRLGLTLNRADLDGLVRQIQRRAPSARFLWRQSLSRTLWAVTVKGVPAVAVYDRKRKTVVTVWGPKDGE